MKLLIFLLAILAVIVQGVRADDVLKSYEETDPLITHFSAPSFQSDISSGVSFVFYGAKWCRHCQKLTPIWYEFEQMVKVKGGKGGKVGKVECTRNEAMLLVV